VTLAEAAISLSFPPSYRQFLIDRGAGGIGAEEIYGLVYNDLRLPSRTPHAIGLTRERSAASPRGRLRRRGAVVAFNLGLNAAERHPRTHRT
jgi:hypothetical protein